MNNALNTLAASPPTGYKEATLTANTMTAKKLAGAHALAAETTT